MRVVLLCSFSIDIQESNHVRTDGFTRHAKPSDVAGRNRGMAPARIMRSANFLLAERTTIRILGKRWCTRTVTTSYLSRAATRQSEPFALSIPALSKTSSSVASPTHKADLRKPRDATRATCGYCLLRPPLRRARYPFSSVPPMHSAPYLQAANHEMILQFANTFLHSASPKGIRDLDFHQERRDDGENIHCHRHTDQNDPNINMRSAGCGWCLRSLHSPRRPA